jgi:hypothetical protein
MYVGVGNAVMSEHARWPGPRCASGTASLQKQGGVVAAAGYKRHKWRALTSREAFGQYDYYMLDRWMANVRYQDVYLCMYVMDGCMPAR